ncbi:MAG: helix-turn-helix domain-containing protein [Verrucomicrobiales bacterium]|nr:helix-turn-helix domain-containing protein [Verrucomicrobiales bacterium]
MLQDNSNTVANGSNPPEGDLLDKPATARLLGISVRTLDGLMAARKVPYLKIGRKIVRFHRQDVIAHLRERFQVGASPR